MAFPASEISKEKAWLRISTSALALKNAVQKQRDDSAAGPTTRQSYLSLQRTIDGIVDQWEIDAVVPGLEAYIRDQINQPLLDLVTEYTAMRVAARAVQTWIFNNMPTDATSGAVLTHTIDSDGNRVDITQSSASVSAFRTLADTFTASIS